MNTLEAEAQAGVLKFEYIIVEQGILLETVEFVEKSHATDAFAEKPAQHAVLRPDMTIFGRNVLDDVVRGGTNNVFRSVGVSLRDACGADILLEELDAVRDNFHQVCKGGARKSHAQAAEQQ